MRFRSAKNMHIDCVSPATILSPSLRDNVLRYGNYYLNGIRYSPSKGWYSEFPLSMFRKLMKSTDHDVFDNYYVMDFDGNQLPLFMLVPCGKCECCRDRKVKEWSTRAICETQTSSSIPYFVTLTYNDDCLPRNGLRKGAIQRFLKRLRINYERLTKRKSNIRYFMCGEYGSHTHRSHYHGILWNIDILDIKQVDDLVQKSWSFAVTKKYYDTLPDKRDKYGQSILKYVDGRSYRVLYGFTRTLPLEKGGYQYVMKYMRKDSFVPIKCNAPFFLSSRRGGLGREWLQNKLDEYRNNPSILNVQLVDKFTGEQYTGVLPTYFKNIIAPPPSRIICKEVRDAVKEYDDIYKVIIKNFNYVNSMRDRVLAHYPTLFFSSSFITNENKKPCELYTELVRNLISRADELEYFLLSYIYDTDLAESSPKYKLKHIAAAKYKLNNLEILSPSDHAIQLRRLRRRSIVREVF